MSCGLGWLIFLNKFTLIIFKSQLMIKVNVFLKCVCDVNQMLLFTPN
jgi:hypothetical protein